ncbi:hypothetical protein V1517DRAFT_304444 [Lipomyces orientalis]|uniref:Uncharacterized protein n=1 Tax=Lipomyces orientalis TaxID=1233043 RepID=A0ACC3TY33_9ASCO
MVPTFENSPGPMSLFAIERLALAVSRVGGLGFIGASYDFSSLDSMLSAHLLHQVVANCESDNFYASNRSSCDPLERRSHRASQIHEITVTDHSQSAVRLYKNVDIVVQGYDAGGHGTDR